MAVLWVLAPATASAKQDRELIACIDPKNLDWDAKIRACTQMIDKGRHVYSFDQLFAAINNRGFSHHQKHQYDAALADYDEAIRLNNPNKQFLASIYSNRGNSWLSKGDLKRAIADQSQAIRLGPKNAAFYTNRARAYREQGDLDHALADFNEAIALSPSFSNPYVGRGLVWRIRGDPDRAIDDFDHAIKLEKSPPALTGRGLAYETKGEYSKARADYMAAIAMPTFSVNSQVKAGVNVDMDRFQDTARARLALLSEADKPPVGSTANSGADSKQRIALVIGNGAYQNVVALRNPPNDARAIGRVLRQIGYEVFEATDLDHVEMGQMLGDFLRRAATARTVVLYYAGHGMQIDGRNYLLPVDAKFGSVSDSNSWAFSQTFDLDSILAALDDQIRTSIVMLDACRDNPLTAITQASIGQKNKTRSVSPNPGLALPSTPGPGATASAGVLVAFAAAPGQVALDGDGENSPFSTALMHHMGTTGLEVQQMLTRVRGDVVAATKGKQVPWSNSSLLGEVYLAGK